ncbi:MFS transporter [Acidicapsa ligni]|uniref:MFS transporter n=1 Tax=Acidicapsa ligni TaxID=542300 RepID=UPI0021E04E63|nr:MFS transporter [Acidicapsa ligni]
MLSEDVAIGRSAMHKATWRLIPLIAVGYGVAYMDRVNIGFAALQMNADLHFSNTVFGIGAGIFFLSYAVCEIPSNLLLYRFGARRWLSRIMLTWGLLAVTMMFVRTPFQFYAVRFLLGVAEAGFFPGVLYYLTQWFPTNIRARAISRFYVSLPLSAVIMGAVAGALLNLQGKMGLRGWQWLFLVEGTPAVLLSAVFLKYLPDSPRNAHWLTAPERSWIENQLASDGSALPGSHATGVGSALRDIRVWLFGLTQLLMLGVNYGYTFSLPAIVKNATAFNNSKVGYIVSGIGLLGAIGMIFNAWFSDRTGKSYLHIIVPSLFESACLLVVAITLKPWIAIPVLALMFFAHNAIQGPLLALPSTFLKGKGAATGLATINMVGMLGGVIYPPFIGWIRDRTGDYQSGLGVLSLTMLAATGVVFVLRSLASRSILKAAKNVHS